MESTWGPLLLRQHRSYSVGGGVHLHHEGLVGIRVDEERSGGEGFFQGVECGGGSWSPGQRLGIVAEEVGKWDFRWMWYRQEDDWNLECVEQATQRNSQGSRCRPTSGIRRSSRRCWDCAAPTTDALGSRQRWIPPEPANECSPHEVFRLEVVVIQHFD